DEGHRGCEHTGRQHYPATFGSNLASDFARADFGGNYAEVAWLDERLRHAPIMNCRARPGNDGILPSDTVLDRNASERNLPDVTMVCAAAAAGHREVSELPAQCTIGGRDRRDHRYRDRARYRVPHGCASRRSPAIRAVALPMARLCAGHRRNAWDARN